MFALRSALALALILLLGLAVPANAGDPAPSPIEREFAGLLNQERAARGLGPVEISPTLTDIADDYAAYNSQVGGIDHDRDAPYTKRAQESGCDEFSWQGPVLAYGYTSAREALDGWLSSPGHAAVLLDPEITHIGPGFTESHQLAFGLPCPPGPLHTSGDFGEGGSSGSDPAARTLSLRYSRAYNFKGKVGSAQPACSARVDVEIVQIKRGQATPVGFDETNARGSFKVFWAQARGRYAARTAGNPTCAAAESDLLKITR